MAYDRKFKISVAKFCIKGNTMDIAVETFSVSKGSVSAWVTEYKTTGDIRERRIQNREHLRKVSPKKIDDFLLQNPNADQVEMAAAFGCNNRAVCAALKKFGYSKKNSPRYIKSPIR